MGSRKQAAIAIASLAAAAALVAAVLIRRHKSAPDDSGQSIEERLGRYSYGGVFGGDRWRNATQDEPLFDNELPNAEHFRSFGPEYQPTVTDDALDDAAALEDTAEDGHLFDEYLEALSKKEAKAVRKVRKAREARDFALDQYRGALGEIAKKPCSDMEPDDRPCGVCAECIASDALTSAGDPGVEEVTRYKNALSYIAEDDCLVSLPDMPACGRCAPCLAKKALAAVAKKGS